MKKNKRVVIIISIVILTIINVFLVFKKDTSIVEKSKVSKIERKEFSIYKEQTYNGEDWKESNDTTFPTSGYLLNTTKTMCYDYNGNKIDYKPTQELTKGSIDGRVTIESSKTIYCELYFDLDNKEPEVKEFSITGKTSSGDTLNNGYTYQTDNIPYTLTYEDEDVTQYCISNTSECTEWKEIKEKTNTLTIDATDGEKTMYIYLKDKANNVSSGKSAKITVDRTAPVVNTFKLTGKADEGQQLSDSTEYTHTKNITYDATIEESNISEYCIYEDNCSYTSLTSTTIKNQNYTLKDTEGNHSVTIRVKDKAGNESDVSTQSIKLDLNNPTATISPNTHDTSSITVTVGYEGQDSIIARQCKLDSESTWTDAKPDGSCTISDLSDGTEYTIEGRVRDASGRWNTTYPNVTVTTDKAGFSGTGKQLIEYNPKGLSSEPDCQGMYRFVGHCDAADDGCNGIIDNFVCFGYEDESDCKVDIASNEYLYRIIGITSDGKMKLIKNKELTQKYKWHESDSNIQWNDSDLFNNLNSSAYLTNLLSSWQNEIERYSWPNGVINDSDTKSSGQFFCNFEKNLPGISAKVGLLTVSDYYYANNQNGTSCRSSDCTTVWLHKKMNGVPSELNNSEWMMLRSDAERTNMSYYISSSGPLGMAQLEIGDSVRPVFYLSQSTYIFSGSGTSTDPFIVGNPECPGCGIIPIP